MTTPDLIALNRSMYPAAKALGDVHIRLLIMRNRLVIERDRALLREQEFLVGGGVDGHATNLVSNSALPTSLIDGRQPAKVQLGHVEEKGSSQDGLPPFSCAPDSGNQAPPTDQPLCFRCQRVTQHCCCGMWDAEPMSADAHNRFPQGRYHEGEFR